MNSQKVFSKYFFKRNTASASSQYRFYSFQRNFFYSNSSKKAYSSSNSYNYLKQLPFVLLVAPISFKILYYTEINKKLSLCAEAPRQDRIRGTYENKIRFFSRPEKIYETFATVKTEDGKLVMSYSDFFKALTPYNYSEMKDNKSYFEKFQPQILKVADVNGDGVISFPEFFFFITLLQLPDSVLIEEFSKIDPQLSLTKKQLSSALTKLRKKTFLGQKQTNKGFVPDARLISATEQEFQETNDFICDHLLQNKEKFTYADFKQLRQQLKTELRHYEFYQYDIDDESGQISAEEFAKSFLICMPFGQVNNYLKRINNLQGFKDKNVSFEEFLAFTFFIDEVEEVKEKVLAFRYITSAQLKEFANEFSEKNAYCKEHQVKVSDVQIDILVQVLDLDGNGQLDHDEVIGVLEGRQMLGMGKEAELKDAVSGTFSKGFSWIKESLKF